MKKNIYMIIALAFLLVHCSKKNDSEQPGANNALRIDTTKTVIINENPIAVFLQYDSTEVEKLKKDGSWDAIMDDMMFYQATAKSALDSNGIKSLYTDKKSLCFITNKNDTFLLEKAALDTADLVLFNGTGSPLITTTTNYEPLYKNYYGLKEVATDPKTTPGSDAKKDSL
ncbi:MAG: hypothetical protein HGB19_12105 [Chlorobiales bacterium]|nr:hypothetical protein [Chlorobiales bacterium]